MARKVVPIAKMSPSNSNKWLNCPGWAQACAGLPEHPPARAAEEGTAAHTLFQLCGALGVEPAEFEGAKLYQDWVVDDEMIVAVQKAFDWLNAWHKKHSIMLFMGVPTVSIKQHHEFPVQLMLGDYEMTGTSDYVARTPRHLLVFDYKHGAGQWVPAEENSQLGLYILGARHTLQLSPKQKPLGVIAQPRIDWGGQEVVRTWEPSEADLTQLHERAREAAHVARIPGAPRRAGKHCKWCGVAHSCRELAEYSLRTAMVEFEDISARPVLDPKDPASLTADGIAYILSNAIVIESWLRAVQSEAMRRLLRHAPVPGFKMVEGRKMRKWINDATVMELLPKELIKTVPLGPAPVLKAMSKFPKQVERLTKLVTYTKPPIHIVSEADPRPAIAGSAALEFKPIDDSHLDSQ
jgi:hypothetical protein